MGGGGQGGCERRSVALVKFFCDFLIWGGGGGPVGVGVGLGVRVDVNGEVKVL